MKWFRHIADEPVLRNYLTHPDPPPLDNALLKRFQDAHLQFVIELKRALDEQPEDEWNAVQRAIRSYTKTNCSWDAYEIAEEADLLMGQHWSPAQTRTSPEPQIF